MENSKEFCISLETALFRGVSQQVCMEIFPLVLSNMITDTGKKEGLVC